MKGVLSGIIKEVTEINFHPSGQICKNGNKTCLLSFKEAVMNPLSYTSSPVHDWENYMSSRTNLKRMYDVRISRTNDLQITGDQDTVLYQTIISTNSRGINGSDRKTVGYRLGCTGDEHIEKKAGASPPR